MPQQPLRPKKEIVEDTTTVKFGELPMANDNGSLSADGKRKIAPTTKKKEPYFISTDGVPRFHQ